MHPLSPVPPPGIQSMEEIERPATRTRLVKEIFIAERIQALGMKEK